MKLNQRNLDSLPSPVKRPLYNRDILKHSIVHIGVGGFHRAHQAFYLDELLNNGNADCTICGLGLKQADEVIYKALKEQNCLYTLMVKCPDGEVQTRVIGSITDYIYVPDNPVASIKKLADPQTQIVSLTITEGGYNFNLAGEFIKNNADVQWDTLHPEAPKTVFGLITAALKIRKGENLRPFTVLSCDNIQHNGDLTRKMLLSYTDMIDKHLSEWIKDNGCFPNSMVDRITPTTTQNDVEFLVRQTEIEDACPVTCEPYIQWVLEDNFAGDRPALEKVGVQFTTNIDPYEKMKIRLLNGGHSFLGILGLLYGYKTIDQTINNPDINKALRKFLDEEVTPILGKIEGINLAAYIANLIERFKNPYIKDQLTRICSESSAKLPKFIIPTIREQLDVNGPIKYTTLILAAWCHLLELYGLEGYDYQFQDEILDLLRMRARSSSKTDPIEFLQIGSVFGDLVNNDRFAEMYLVSIESLRRQDITEVVKQLIKQ